jgi:predicted amidohydrolase YtcJ
MQVKAVPCRLSTCVGFAVSLLLTPFAHSQQPAPTPPTLILTGGKVFTADSARPWAEAVAIRGDRIAAVGTTAEIRRLANSATREIALGGRVVIPGINDAHDHLGETALGPGFRTGPSPMPDPTPGQVLDSLRSLAARAPSGSWLRTQIGMGVLSDTSINRATLDRAAPNHPVMLHGWWGHGMVLNSAALRALEIADDARDPLGGWYSRGRDGRLTGRADIYANWDAQRRLAANHPEAALVAALREFSDSSIRMGVTSVQNMAGALAPGLTARVFRDARLPIRVRLVRWSIPTPTSMNAVEWDTVTERIAARVIVDGRKWVPEGTPIEQFALRRTPYPGRPDWYGRLAFPVDTIRAMLAAALLPKAPQLHIHIVGDSTAELVLDGMEALAPDSVWRERRVRFEHGIPISGAQIARVARLGVVIAQPRGPLPYRSWRAAGIPVAYGSDMLRNPFVHMITVVTGAEMPAEAVSREEAVRMYTYGSAFAERKEKEKGTLAPGMLADLAVLSQDIFTVPIPALPATRSVLTVIGGEVVHDSLPRM